MGARLYNEDLVLFAGEGRMKISSLAKTTAVGAVALLAIAVSTPAHAVTCKGFTVWGNTVTGRVFQRLLVEPRARRNWSSKVRNMGGLGPAWASWSLARDKDMDCKRHQPGNNWHCRAHGRPCRP